MNIQLNLLDARPGDWCAAGLKVTFTDEEREGAVQWLLWAINRMCPPEVLAIATTFVLALRDTTVVGVVVPLGDRYEIYVGFDAARRMREVRVRRRAL